MEMEMARQSSCIRLGMYWPGNGTGGPWRNVHSIVAALGADEFDVTVFCDFPWEFEPRPSVKFVRLNDRARAQDNGVVTVSGTQEMPRRMSLIRLAPRPARASGSRPC